MRRFPPKRAGVGVYKAMREKRRAVFIIERFLNTPPHFHAFYQENNALFSLDGHKISGEMPEKQCKMIEVWAMIHKEELEANWQLSKDKQELYKIDPLR